MITEADDIVVFRLAPAGGFLIAAFTARRFARAPGAVYVERVRTRRRPRRVPCAAPPLVRETYMSDGEDAKAARIRAAAQRALAEAEARKAEAADVARPVELGGRDGPEPVRYGDWEKKGIAVDF